MTDGLSGRTVGLLVGLVVLLALKAIKGINAGIETKMNGRTVFKIHNQTEMNQAELSDTRLEQNILLHQQLNKTISLFNQMHPEVQKTAKKIPELQTIDLTWNTAPHLLDQNSSKIAEGFNQILMQMDQMNGHASLNQTLLGTTVELKTQLKDKADKNKRKCLFLMDNDGNLSL